MKCQKCRQTIKLHSSLEDIAPAAFNLLIAATSSSSTVSSDTASSSSKHQYPPNFPAVSSNPAFKRAVPRPNISKSIYQNPAESFVVLTQSQVIPPPSRQLSSTGGSNEPEKPEGEVNALSEQIRTSENLFELLSARTDIDHPACVECSQLLVEGYEKRLAAATRERDAFIEFLKTTNAEVPTDAEREAEERELRQLEAEEAAALKELQDLEKEHASVQAELKNLETESKKLDAEEESFWRDRNAFSLKLEEYQNERDGVNLQYDHDSRQLEKLQRTNVYNDTFCIGHDGFFGTINGLRLGRLTTHPVEWSEINAAWGQTLLLLATIADKLNFVFDGYRLKPMGSTSRIEKIEPPASGSAEPKTTVLELFSSGDMPLGGLFMHRKFDLAMVAFLECLRQLGESVEKTDSHIALPYKIAKDKIGDSCIRLAFNQTEAWTRACKYTLTCVKFLLAHTRFVRDHLVGLEEICCGSKVQWARGDRPLVEPFVGG